MGAVVCIAGGVLWQWGRLSAVWSSSTYPTVAMNPLAAFCFLGVALSLALLLHGDVSSGRYRWGRRLASGVVVLNLIRLLQYVFHSSHPIDQVFFRSVIGSNRMAPMTVVFFVFIGLALLTLDRRAARQRE